MPLGSFGVSGNIRRDFRRGGECGGRNRKSRCCALKSENGIFARAETDKQDMSHRIVRASETLKTIDAMQLDAHNFGFYSGHNFIYCRPMPPDVMKLSTGFNADLHSLFPNLVVIKSLHFITPPFRNCPPSLIVNCRALFSFFLFFIRQRRGPCSLYTSADQGR